MIKVEKNDKDVVVMTFGPDEHNMLMMTPVRISLTGSEARDLAKRLGTMLDEKPVIRHT